MAYRTALTLELSHLIYLFEKGSRIISRPQGNERHPVYQHREFDIPCISQHFNTIYLM
jgi:hypothetical protein